MGTDILVDLPEYRKHENQTEMYPIALKKKKKANRLMWLGHGAPRKEGLR